MADDPPGYIVFWSVIGFGLLLMALGKFAEWWEHHRAVRPKRRRNT